jgi:hypothetical protein
MVPTLQVGRRGDGRGILVAHNVQKPETHEHAANSGKIGLFRGILRRHTEAS